MVIVLDKRKRPAGFTTERRARKLMEKRRAVLYRAYPCTIIVKDLDVRTIDTLPAYRLKIDPGAKYTGMAVVCNETNEVMLYLQIEHRGELIKEAMDTRKNIRRNRRSRETWYRRPKWKAHRKDDNFRADSSREKGWIPPSVKSTADNIIHWALRLKKFIRLTTCSLEAVRFDMQLLQNPDVSGLEYQHGTLFGYEMKEYLLETYGHKCQYCGGLAGDPILEWEHMTPKSRGGTDRVDNANLACKTCNQDKGNRTLPEYLEVLKKRKPKSKKQQELNNERIRRISAIVEKGTIYKDLRYAAWTNVTRGYDEKHLFAIFGDVECSSGGRTKYNRKLLGLPKDHHYDALCVGAVPESGYKDRTHGYCLYVQAMGRGTRLLGHINKCGIITVKYRYRNKRMRSHGVNGTTVSLQTGDMVRAVIPGGKYQGTYTGRVMIRRSGAHDISIAGNVRVTGTKKTVYQVLQRSDGYAYKYA